MTVLYFARLRDEIGTSEETLEPPEHVHTVAELIVWLRDQSEGHAHALGPGTVLKVAVNQEYAGPDAPIGANDEVALFPPVTGG